MDDVHHNYSYFPIFIDEKKYGTSRDNLYNHLKQNNIYGRRYFYPIVTNFEEYAKTPLESSDNLTLAEKLSRQVICLPVFPGLSMEQIEIICKHLNQFSK
jgi:dTDP-4-amino-4,6-dideoxygalactose transaminase